MQINNTDIRTFSAKQLKVSYPPPSTAVNVELFDGALTPSESETYTPLSELTVEIYFRGQTRNEIQRYVSDFNAMLQKGVILTLDGYERKFKAYMTGNTLNKTITGTRYKAEFTFNGYWFSDTVTLTWQEVHEAKFEAAGNRWSPCKLSITALEYIEVLKINGFSDELTINVIPRGATVVIDSTKGFITMDGANKFGDVDGMMEFPFLKTGEDREHHLIFSDKNIIVTLEYNPMWL